MELMPDDVGGGGAGPKFIKAEGTGRSMGDHKPFTSQGHDDKGSAARFFYCSKAGRSERGEGNKHPTVKPLKLMRYLLKLITQPQVNMILDPFAGSGTTGVACALAGLPCVLIEKEEEYYRTCIERVRWAAKVRERYGGSPPMDLDDIRKKMEEEEKKGEDQLCLW